MLFSFEGKLFAAAGSYWRISRLQPHTLFYNDYVGLSLDYFLGRKYESPIGTTIIGSSNHFEVAIAVPLYGTD